MSICFVRSISLAISFGLASEVANTDKITAQTTLRMTIKSMVYRLLGSRVPAASSDGGCSVTRFPHFAIAEYSIMVEKGGEDVANQDGEHNPFGISWIDGTDGN